MSDSYLLLANKGRIIWAGIAGTLYISSGSGGMNNSQIQLIANNTFIKNSRLVSSTLGGEKGGNINLWNKGDLDISHSILTSRIDGSEAIGKGGDISIVATNFSMTGASKINTVSSATAKPGLIDISIEDTLSMSGINTNIVSRSDEGLDIGNIIINSNNNITIFNGAAIRSTTTGAADSGEITIKGNTINLYDGGSINSTASVFSSQLVLGGSAGDIHIDTNSLNLSGNTTSITSSSFDSGQQSGSVFITSGDVNLTDGARITATTERPNLENNQFKPENNGGIIEIDSRNLILKNSQITTSVTGGTQGNGGDSNSRSCYFPMKIS